MFRNSHGLASVHWVVLAILGGLLAVASACSPAPRDTNIQKVVVTASEFRFQPVEFKLSAGVPTQLTLINEGSVEHDFTAIELSMGGQVVAQEHSPGVQAHATKSLAAGTVHAVAPKQQRTTITFTPKAGTYEFVCIIPGHQDAGMRGVLLVE